MPPTPSSPPPPQNHACDIDKNYNNYMLNNKKSISTVCITVLYNYIHDDNNNGNDNDN